MPYALSLLPRHLVLRATDLACVEAFAASLPSAPALRPDDRTRFAYVNHGAQLGRLSIGATTSSGYRVDQAAPSDLLVHCVAGRIGLGRGAESAVLRAGQSAYVAAGPRTTRTSDGSVAVYANMPGPARAGRASLFVDRSGRLADPLLALVDELGRSDLPLEAAPVTAAWTALLEEAVSDRLAFVSDRMRTPGAAQVRRAEELLLADLSASRSVASVAAELGVGVRALQAGFKRHRGVAPTGVRAAARLRSVRARLLSAPPGESVTAILAGSGVAHPGRFAAAYRRSYGETPAATLARRREWPQP